MATTNSYGQIISGSKVMYHGQIFDVGEVFEEKVILYQNNIKVAVVSKYEVAAI